MTKPDRPIAPQYVKASTLAAMLDVSESTIQDWTSKGILPAPRRIGGSVRWRWTDVVAKIEGMESPDEDPILRASRGG